MTDAVRSARSRWTDGSMDKLVKKRYAAERRFKFFGLAAVSISVAFLAFLLITMVSNGAGGFFRTEASLTVNFAASDMIVDPASLEGSDAIGVIVNSGLESTMRDAAVDQYGADARGLFSTGGLQTLQEAILDDPEILVGTLTMDLPVSSEVHLAATGEGNPEAEALVQRLERQDSLSSGFNSTFFTASDATDPSAAGVWGALIGSLLTILVTMALAFPIGVLAAIYLEEFAPKNRWTDIVEVSINNLAAVPSIIFGLLGLSVFLNFMHLPRSAPLVGGLTLALMTMPVIVIAGRNAIQAVPPSIRSAALGVGASKVQVVFHHVLPLALPGILTGTIIGMARALGETAPLLLIGMRAFLASPPSGITDRATVLPMQIFLWSDEVDRGFVEKTSAAIIVLLIFMLLMNGLAIYLRNRFERSW